MYTNAPFTALDPKEPEVIANSGAYWDSDKKSLSERRNGSSSIAYMYV